MRSPFELLLPGFTHERLRVLSFDAHERLSHGYEVNVRVSTPEPHRDMPDELVGRHAAFRIDLEPTPRTFHGVIAEVSLEDVTRSGGEAFAEYRLRLVPRLALLTQRHRSRVFQGRSVREVVQIVLGEGRIPALWMLERELPRRDYITQFEETDEAFVRRLTAEAGVFFFFLQPPVPPEVVSQIAAIADAAGGVIGAATGGGFELPSITGEVMVFADAAFAYQGIGELPAALEQLVRTGLAELNQLTGGAVGTATEVVGAAAPLVQSLGGPDLRSLMSLGNSRHLAYRPSADALVHGDRDVVTTFKIRDAVRTQRTSFRTYDPRRPLARLESHEPRELSSRLGLAEDASGALDAVTDATGAVAGAVGSLAGGTLGSFGRILGETLGRGELERYEHHDAFLLPEWDHTKDEATRMLRAVRRDHRLADGESACPILACGARFTLDDFPAEWANREYALVEVRHEGQAHGDATGELIYRNRFRCVPSDVAFPPPRPPRRTVQTCLTATVIGASDEADMMTRGMGEVKVRFHWEREGHGTCWIRTMQAWGGAGWGTQFMPRIGMEVVVGFEGGDPDKPMVLGSVYNGTHPPPFTLPESQTRSGIRTRSTPGDGGHNELSFEDRRDSEQVYVHAQRNLDVEVRHDRSLQVDNDDATRVDHDQCLDVAGAQHTEVRGGQHLTVQPVRRVVVEGAHEMVTRGDWQESVTGRASSAVRGAFEREVGGGSRERVNGDTLRQIRGNLVELVGSHESPRSRSLRVEGRSELSASGPNEIASDEELVLRVGQSSIRLTADRIQLSSPEILVGAEDATAKLGAGNISLITKGTLAGIADKVVMKGNGAALGLSSEASLDGARVLLNSPETAEDSVESEPVEPTVIELKDQDGNPLPYERYCIALSDGGTLAGVLDADGRAEVILEGGGEVTFPDLPEVEPQ